MAWFLLLGLFWKPVYWAGKFVYAKYIKKDDTHSFNAEQFKEWFKILVSLVKP
jgi:hypothetical protein